MIWTLLCDEVVLSQRLHKQINRSRMAGNIASQPAVRLCAAGIRVKVDGSQFIPKS